jgi:hypothetical protein
MAIIYLIAGKSLTSSWPLEIAKNPFSPSEAHCARILGTPTLRKDYWPRGAANSQRTYRTRLRHYDVRSWCSSPLHSTDALAALSLDQVETVEFMPDLAGLGTLDTMRQCPLEGLQQFNRVPHLGVGVTGSLMRDLD